MSFPQLAHCYFVHGEKMVLLSYSCTNSSPYIRVTGLSPNYYKIYSAQDYYVRAGEEYVRVSDLIPRWSVPHARTFRLRETTFLGLRPVDDWESPSYEAVVRLIPKAKRKSVELLA